MVTRDAKPGGFIEARVVLKVKRASDTPVNAITMKLFGAERFRYVTNRPAAVVRTVVNLVATVKQGGTLSEGTHTFVARFDLPANATPSYLGTHLYVG
jgi:hypothetical protein